MQEKTEKNHIFYKSAKNDPPICVPLTMPKSDTGQQHTLHTIFELTNFPSATFWHTFCYAKLRFRVRFLRKNHKKC